jgi:methionyl-tRNA formyltransferase
MRIVFMGTPDFAVPSLEALVTKGYNVVGVITATDKWGGRGNKELLESAVKKVAVKLNLPVLQPTNLKSPAFLSELEALNADLQIVVAFRMLPEKVWAMPRLGTFNLHASLLPKYRGAAPINWAIIQGEKETGVTTFFLQQEIDTGNIILQEKMAITETENVGEIYVKLMSLGAAVVLKTVKLIEEDKVVTTVQNELLASPAPKIFTETCQIDFSKTVDEVYNFVRGLSPYPAAWTKIKEQPIKLFAVKKELAPTDIPIGTIVTEAQKVLKIAVKDGFVHLLEVQPAGKKRMDIQSYLNGHHF